MSTDTQGFTVGQRPQFTRSRTWLLLVIFGIVGLALVVVS